MLLLIGALSLAVQVSSAHAQAERPSCTKVIGAVNSYTTTTGGTQANPKAVAKQLNTEAGWVRRCMEAYGRVPRWRSDGDDQQREALERAFEEGRDVDVTAENSEQSWERKRELRIEQKEHLERKKELEQKRKFDQSSDPFFKMQEY